VIAGRFKRRARRLAALRPLAGRAQWLALAFVKTFLSGLWRRPPAYFHLDLEGTLARCPTDAPEG
jgi:hypothetical protein